MRIVINTDLYDALYVKKFTITYKGIERPALTFYADAAILPIDILQKFIAEAKFDDFKITDGETQTEYKNYSIVSELSQKYDKDYCKTPDDNITVLSLIQLTDNEVEIKGLKNLANTLSTKNAYLESALAALQASTK